MKITLLVTTFNSLTQLAYTHLKDKQCIIDIVYIKDECQTIKEIELFAPDIILSPFLKTYISANIYNKYPTFIFHPGIIGDRGPNALEYALLSHTKEWGVVILKANKFYDGGDIYASSTFKVRDTYKASLYRQEISLNFLKILKEFFKNYQRDIKTPQIMNQLHKKFNQDKRAIDWRNDNTQIIINKINLSDSFPGVLDEVNGIKCYLFGVHKEDRLRGNIKQIIAKRDGAICLGTKDGAIWISHLKKINSFKLPATYVLKDKIKGIKENRLPLIFDKSYNTFYEISVKQIDNVVYLSFNFHNGAMSSKQCIRLKYAIEYLKSKCEVLVLTGGLDFFSNGIHLNILEDSKKQGEDGWSNINAMNDLIKSIIEADEIVTVASFYGGAGAGGVFLGLACDYVVAQNNIVINPHYKTLGLSGSEYHTYTLPKKVGKSVTDKLLNDALPISAKYAKKICMIDKILEADNYTDTLHEFCKNLYNDDFIWKKQDFLEENINFIENCKKEELKKMYPEFWDKHSKFHKLRHEFVYKICPLNTPQRLKKNHA